MLLQRDDNPKWQLPVSNMATLLPLTDKDGREGVVKVLAEHAGVNRSLKQSSFFSCLHLSSILEKITEPTTLFWMSAILPLNEVYRYHKHFPLVS